MLTRTIKPEAPPIARQPCAAPAVLPDRQLGESEATALWARDRKNLAACEQRRAAAVAAIDGAKR